MNYDELYDQLHIEKRLVTDFSILFARFEYALKKSRYAEGDENGIKANWDDFAQDHDSTFKDDKTEELRSSVQYLCKQPPKKQILRNGVLDWKPVSLNNVPLLQQLVMKVRRTRNNLFHGGKFDHGLLEEPGRDSDLLLSCMIILEECLSLDEGVQQAFWKNEL